MLTAILLKISDIIWKDLTVPNSRKFGNNFRGTSTTFCGQIGIMLTKSAAFSEKFCKNDEEF